MRRDDWRSDQGPRQRAGRSGSGRGGEAPSRRLEWQPPPVARAQGGAARPGGPFTHVLRGLSHGAPLLRPAQQLPRLLRPPAQIHPRTTASVIWEYDARQEYEVHSERSAKEFRFILHRTSQFSLPHLHHSPCAPETLPQSAGAEGGHATTVSLPFLFTRSRLCRRLSLFFFFCFVLLDVYLFYCTTVGGVCGSVCKHAAATTWMARKA